MNCDHNLFLALNFDGGPFMDRLMLTVSGTTMWLPLYALILWLVWRRDGWRNVILFTALMIAALVLSDMISGIFKHNGVLGGLLPDFEPRWRPMFTPALEGLEIAPDSLRKLRWLTPDSLPPPGGAPSRSGGVWRLAASSRSSHRDSRLAIPSKSRIAPRMW